VRSAERKAGTMVVEMVERSVEKKDVSTAAWKDVYSAASSGCG
jgi:hypothetical protein